LPNIANISIIALLFFLIFGIIGVNYFKGALFICNQQRFDNLVLVTKWDCLNGGGDWLPNSFSYDNIIVSIQTFFQLATTIDWSNIMFQSMSYTQIDYVMVNKNRPYWALFFIFFIVIGAFFFFNLFVGVVISTFNREKDKIGGNNLLTER